MHMMMGGAMVLVLIVVIAAAFVGWPLVFQNMPIILGAVLVGAAAGLGGALATAWRERRENQPRVPSSLQTKPKAQRCPNCGSPIDSENALCPSCHLDLKRNCPQCGAIVNTQASACPACGEKLRMQV